MKGSETIFSNDDDFFEDAKMRKETKGFESTHDNRTHSKNNTSKPFDRRGYGASDKDQEDNPMYDPPSRICGGAVFSKLRAIGGGKQHTKLSSDEDPQSKKDKKQPHKQKDSPTETSSSKLISKLTQKLMKRKTDTGASTAATVEQEHPFQSPIAMPTSVAMSSLSDPSLASSPWVTDDETEEGAAAAFLHNTMGFYNGRMSNELKEERAIVISTPGDSTTSHYTNQAQILQDSAPDPRSFSSDPATLDLQNLLEEMKALNGKVQENSNVLQKGIENIALELQQQQQQQQHKKDGISQPPASPKNDTLMFGENHDENPNTSTNSVETSAIDANNDQIKKLEEERTYYRSEAETLRMEMENIKSQLNELRSFLPQLANSSSSNNNNNNTVTENTNENLPQLENNQQAKNSEESSFLVVLSKNHTDDDNHSVAKSFDSEDALMLKSSQQDHLETIDNETIDEPINQSHLEITENNYKNPSDYLETIDYPHSNSHYLETIDNPSFSSSVKMSSFRSEIREILSSSNYNFRTGIGSRAVKNAEALVQQHHHEQPIRTVDEEPIIPAPSNTSEEAATPTVIPRRKVFRGRSVSPMRRQSSINSDPVEDHRSIDSSENNGNSQNQEPNSMEQKRAETKKLEYSVAKSFYKKQWKDTNSVLETKTLGNDSPLRDNNNTDKTERGSSFLAADKKYRELRRSFQQDFSAKSGTSATSSDTRSATTKFSSHTKLDPPTEEDTSEEYLRELRRSWYAKRGLALDSILPSDDAGNANLDDASALSTSPPTYQGSGGYRLDMRTYR